ncbi:MAG: glutamate synthase subunit alpha, partial [Candidatus Omnitrophota bacterium]
MENKLIRDNYFPKKQGLYDPRFEHDACGVGFVCDIKGRKGNRIVKQSLEVLRRLSHRGATGADPKTGDGAGILMQLPHEFFLSVCPEAGINLPEEGAYGSGIVFLPTDISERQFCKDAFIQAIHSAKQSCLGWRSVPVDNSDIGLSAKVAQPVIEQVFIGRNLNSADELDFERKLYIIRKHAESIVRSSQINQKSFFYIISLSSRTFIYKGLLMPHQVEDFFPDLKSGKMKSALALVHSRYSTNTFPTWDLSQPFRFIAHNGEINTLRGNINWMRGRESLLKSGLFGKDLEKISPVLVPGGSDSANIDNIFE